MVHHLHQCQGSNSSMLNEGNIFKASFTLHALDQPTQCEVCFGHRWQPSKLKSPQLRKSFIYDVTGDFGGSWICFQDTL